MFSPRNHDAYCNPNINYDILQDQLTTMKDKHLPYKLVKSNKYKHKNSKWITQGIIKSIKYKDKLYKGFDCTLRSNVKFAHFKERLNTFNKLLKKIIREAQVTHYNKQIDENKSKLRKTWSKINEILCKTSNKNMI